MFSSRFMLFATSPKFFLISRFMLFSTLNKSAPSLTGYMGGGFLQILERDSWNLYPLYPLFPCSDFVCQTWGWLGGGGAVMFFSHFMLFLTFLEKNSGNTNQLFLI